MPVLRLDPEQVIAGGAEESARARLGEGRLGVRARS